MRGISQVCRNEICFDRRSKDRAFLRLECDFNCLSFSFACWGQLRFDSVIRDTCISQGSKRRFVKKGGHGGRASVSSRVTSKVAGRSPWTAHTCALKRVF
jgi:hypothetical protein